VGDIVAISSEGLFALALVAPRMGPGNFPFFFLSHELFDPPFGPGPSSLDGPLLSGKQVENRCRAAFIRSRQGSTNPKRLRIAGARKRPASS